jgi:hypothetical protein
MRANTNKTVASHRQYPIRMVAPPIKPKIMNLIIPGNPFLYNSNRAIRPGGNVVPPSPVYYFNTRKGSRVPGSPLIFSEKPTGFFRNIGKPRPFY